MVTPKLTTTWGAGFSFSKCHAERRVPYDPYLEGIFDGEEFSKMVRLWTNGYDVYTPSRSHIVHDYNHAVRGGEGRGEERVNGGLLPCLLGDSVRLEARKRAVPG